jgi:hypothetical protein
VNYVEEDETTMSKWPISPRWVSAAVTVSDAPRVALPLALSDLRGKLARIPLATLGTWYKGARKFSITLQDLSDAVRNFRKRKADLVVDYEHASENPEVAAGGAIPAAGWLKSVDDGPDDKGILWGQAELTDDTLALVKAKKLKYVSPFLDWTQRDRANGQPQGLTFTSIALTNRPFLDAMPAIALSEAGWERSDGGQTSLGTGLLVSPDESGGNRNVSSKYAQLKDGIDLRVRQLMAQDTSLGYQAAFASVAQNESKLMAAFRDAIGLEIANRTKQFIANHPNSDYSAALTAVVHNDPILYRDWDYSLRGFPLGPQNDDRAWAEEEIIRLTQEKISASDHEISYGDAWATVCRQHRDLARKAYR